MIKIAIIEDDIDCASELQAFITRYKIDNSLAIETKRFTTADEFLECFSAGSYQMIFLDIEMPGTNGMEAAKIIRTKDNQTLLFFVTNLSQYALESYEVQAFNFMVKPLDYDNFVLKIDRAINRIKNVSDQKLILTIREENHGGCFEKIINASEIKYVEVYNHLITYHTTDGDFVTRDGSMKTVREKFSPYGFFMCDQSYLINLRFVTKINKEDCFVGNDKIKISRRRRNEFLSAIAEYISFGSYKI